MPQHVRDAKTAFYNMRLKADCCTGISSDEEAREYFLKNGFASVPEEVKSASTARNIRDIINLDSSDSDDSSVFMPKGEGEKKETEKDNKGKGKRKYFYESDSSSSIEGKKKQTKKSNTQIKTKEEIKMSEKTKKDVEGILMYKKKQPVKKEGKMQDPGVVMVQGLLQSREEDRRMREHQMEIYRLEMERMEKRREQREDERDRRHHELMMMLMMTVSGKDTNSLNCTTNNPIVSPFAGKKSSPKIPRSISYLTNDDNGKEHNEDKEESKNDDSKDKSDKSDESTVLQISQDVLFYQEEGFKMSPETRKKLNEKHGYNMSPKKKNEKKEYKDDGEENKENK
jgi:hypothetical protein